jgi:dynein heavy chain
VSIASDQKKVLDMEDRVLTMLSESTGNILDNEELISKLETAKKTSAVVKVRIEEGEKTNVEISKTRVRVIATWLLRVVLLTALGCNLGVSNQ